MNYDGDDETDFKLRAQYPIADKNRKAKMRFLKGMTDYYEKKRQNSLPNLCDIEKKEKKIDYSVPGTPISSRYLQEIKDSLKETKAPDEFVVSGIIIDKFVEEMNQLTNKIDPLDKFISDMETLNSKKIEVEELNPVDNFMDEIEPLKSKKIEKNNEVLPNQGDALDKFIDDMESLKSNKIEKVEETEQKEIEKPINPRVREYFSDSEDRNSYKRTLSELMMWTTTDGTDITIPGVPVDSRKLMQKKIDEFFKESERRNSYRRSFSEVAKFLGDNDVRSERYPVLKVMQLDDSDDEGITLNFGESKEKSDLDVNVAEKVSAILSPAVLKDKDAESEPKQAVQSQFHGELSLIKNDKFDVKNYFATNLLIQACNSMKQDGDQVFFIPDPDDSNELDDDVITNNNNINNSHNSNNNNNSSITN